MREENASVNPVSAAGDGFDELPPLEVGVLADGVEMERYCLKHHPCLPSDVCTLAHWLLELSSTVREAPCGRIATMPLLRDGLDRMLSDDVVFAVEEEAGIEEELDFPE